MNGNGRLSLAVGFLVTALASQGSGELIVIQPDEAEAKDASIYQFVPNSTFDDEGLSVVNSSIGHSFHSFIQFDLPAIDPAEIISAQLTLFGPQVSGFGVGPSPAFPIQHDLHLIEQSWAEDAVNWNNQPGVSASPTSSLTLDHDNDFFTFDVTDAVMNWITDPASNFGLRISQPVEVRDANFLNVGLSYQSSAGANRPALQILTVPEPGTFALFGSSGGLVALFAMRRSMRQAAQAKAIRGSSSSKRIA